MKLRIAIAMQAGGVGSGCHGNNCGRPKTGISVVHPIGNRSDLLNVIKQWRRYVRPGEDSRAADAARMAMNVQDHFDQYGALGMYDTEHGNIGIMQLSGTKGSGAVWVEYLGTNPGIIKGKIPVHGVGTRMMIEAAKVAANKGTGLKLVALAGAEKFYEKLGMHRADHDTEPPHRYEWTKDEAAAFAKYGQIHAGYSKDDVDRMISEALEEEKTNPPIAWRKR